nr:hypothetical protein [Tanacetum cinerariifolium]
MLDCNPCAIAVDNKRKEIGHVGCGQGHMGRSGKGVWYCSSVCVCTGKAGGIGPNWMFDIDTLTMSMNYQPVSAGNQMDPVKEGDNNDEEKDLRDQEEALRKQFKQESKRLFGQGEVVNTNSTNRLNTVSSPVIVVSSSFTTVDLGRERAQRNEFKSMFGQDKDANGNRMFSPVSAIGSTYVNLGGSILVNVVTLHNVDLLTDPLMPDFEDTVDLQDTGIFSGAYDDLVQLWSLVKKRFSLTEPIDDKEKLLWKGMDIYMLVEKEYPLSRGILTQMLCAKLLVEGDSKICRELIRKIFMQQEVEALRAKAEAADQRAKALQASLEAAQMDIRDLIESRRIDRLEMAKLRSRAHDIKASFWEIERHLGLYTDRLVNHVKRQEDKVTEDASKKRKWEGDHDGSSNQQQNKGHKLIGGYAAKQQECKTKSTCYECGILGYYKSSYPKWKSQNQVNKHGKGKARGDSSIMTYNVNA